MKIKYSPKFKKSFKKLSPEKQRQTTKAINYFSEDIRHPSLNYERVGSKDKNLYTIRVNQGDRVLLFCVISNEYYTLIDVGTHDEIYRKVDTMK